MSMEFFAYPYMERFFEKDTKKYLYSHLVDAVEFLPYGAAIDEFQHFVYENPNVKPVERRAKWREIEHKYQPLKISTPFLIRGPNGSNNYTFYKPILLHRLHACSSLCLCFL